MISVESALERITGVLPTLPAEQVSLSDALGRVLAVNVKARVTQPPVAVSAMDGYAVRAADVAQVPATLQLIGVAPAGGAYEGEVGPQQAVRIMTGAPLPDGADTIVIQEDTEADGDAVTVREGAAPGTFIRPAGLDFRAGEVGLEAGRVLTARDVGLAAAMNVPWLEVRRRPRIAILATGDEVVMPGDPKGPYQIVGSNGLALAAFVTACGGAPINLGIALDTRESLQALAAGARGADMLVTTGGASVGEHDLIRPALGEKGLKVEFWRIAMRPGKPLMFGSIGDTPMLGLPGNPVSTLVCAMVFLGPAMERMLAVEPGLRPPVSAVLARELDRNDRRQDYLRARLSRSADGALIVTPFEQQDSSMLSHLAHADCLIVRPPHAEPVAAGTPIEVLPMVGGALNV
ncbi:MAG: gephyrin-like molybdotransferase Glp [Kiloniellales bacterium]